MPATLATGGVNANPSIGTDMLALHTKTSGTNTNGITLRRHGDTADMMQVNNTADILRNARGTNPAGAPGVGMYVGAGAPAITASNGSIYQRTDGAGTTDNLYVRRGGAWVGIA